MRRLSNLRRSFTWVAVGPSSWRGCGPVYTASCGRERGMEGAISCVWEPHAFCLLRRLCEVTMACTLGWNKVAAQSWLMLERGVRKRANSAPSLSHACVTKSGARESGKLGNSKSHPKPKNIPKKNTPKRKSGSFFAGSYQLE